MSFFSLMSAVFVVAAVLSYINHRFIKAPTTIGVMAIALMLSLALLLVDFAGAELHEPARDMLETLEFEETLMNGMLAFLLFAGSLHVNLGELGDNKKIIGTLATAGVMITTFAVAGLIKLLTIFLNVEMRFIDCLVFGALISPTDPIAVMGILKSAKAPKSLETTIAGESLFNDGIGVVVFLVIISIAVGADGAHGEMDAGAVGLLLLKEVVGGILLGFAGGYVAYKMIATIDDYHVEVLITLALAMGLYSLAAGLHSSGPLAVVVAGIMIGNSGREFAMSDKTRDRLDTFWELLDELLNVVLFVLIGLELLVLEFDSTVLLIGVCAIPLTLFSRFISVGGAVTVLRRFTTFSPHAIKIMTWGGLRGGISVALALSIPNALPARSAIVTITYVVVVFSILVQGLTVKRLIGLIPSSPAPPPEPPPEPEPEPEPV